MPLSIQLVTAVLVLAVAAICAFAAWPTVIDGKRRSPWHLVTRWEELLWLAGVLALLLVGYYLIPRIDPRSGIDGWGVVWSMLVTMLALFLAGFFAWLCQRLYFRELSDTDEEDLAAIVVGAAGDPALGPDGRPLFIPEEDRHWRGRHALFLLLIDRGLWLAVFLIAFAALAGWR